MDFKAPHYTNRPVSTSPARLSIQRARIFRTNQTSAAKNPLLEMSTPIQGDTFVDEPDISPSTTAVMQYELSNSAGYRKSYTKQNAAISLWRRWCVPTDSATPFCRS